MISIVIRNKNEAKYLERTLSILTKLYKNDFDEIVLVDNYSTDNSLAIANSYNCKVMLIKDFTYGKALNLGITNAKNELILLLSSHAIPVGSSFFTNAVTVFQSNKKAAGIRFINSIANYERAIANNFEVINPLTNGLMAGCCMISKNVWQEYKFDEDLAFSEDKEWSKRVIENGFKIADCNETFFYDINRSQRALLNRHKNETLSFYMLNSDKRYPNSGKLVLTFLYKIGFLNNVKYLKNLVNDFKIVGINFKIKSILKKKNDE